MVTRLLRVMLLAALLVLAPLSTSCARTIHFTTDPEKQGGFLIEITKAAFARVGHEVKIEYQPWARALRSVMDGQSEALLGAYYNDERAAKMRYSDVIARTDMLFFALKGAPIVYRNIDDLRPDTVGTIIAADYPPEFNAAQFIRKEPVSDHVINISKLQSAYRVRLDGHGNLEWLSMDDDQEMILTEEPEASFWLRVHNLLVSPFVPEQLL